MLYKEENQKAKRGRILLPSSKARRDGFSVKHKDIWGVGAEDLSTTGGSEEKWISYKSKLG